MKYATAREFVGEARRDAVSKAPYAQPAAAPSKPAAAPAPAAKPTPPRDWMPTFKSVVSAVDTSRTGKRALAEDGINRLLAETAGQKLIADLVATMHQAGKRIHLSFMDQLPEGSDEGNTGGFFSPDDWDYHTYDIFISMKGLGVEMDKGGSVMKSVWPGARDGDGRLTAGNIWFSHKTPGSFVADTLFHELLHIWFIQQTNMQTNISHTGHRDVLQGEIEPLFLERLKAFSAQLDAREGATR